MPYPGQASSPPAAGVCRHGHGEADARAARRSAGVRRRGYLYGKSLRLLAALTIGVRLRSGMWSAQVTFVRDGLAQSPPWRARGDRGAPREPRHAVRRAAQRFYASTLELHLPAAVAMGQLALPADGPVSWTSHPDLAEVAAVALTRDDALDGVSHQLVAPRTWNFAQVADELAEVLGRTVERVVFDDDAWTAARGGARDARYRVGVLLGDVPRRLTRRVRRRRPDAGERGRARRCGRHSSASSRKPTPLDTSRQAGL